MDINTTRLYLERKRKKLTQEAMAKAIGISRVAYLNIEAGKAVPSLQTLIELAKLLNCSLDYLVGLSDLREIHSPPEPNTIYTDIQSIIETVENNSSISERSRTEMLTLLRLSQRLINE